MTKEEAIEWLTDIKCVTENWAQEEAIDMAIDALSAHELTGRIITKTSGMFQPTMWAICSECRKPIDSWDKYCRHCGVKMDGDKE